MRNSDHTPIKHEYDTIMTDSGRYGRIPVTIEGFECADCGKTAATPSIPGQCLKD